MEVLHALYNETPIICGSIEAESLLKIVKQIYFIKEPLENMDDFILPLKFIQVVSQMRNRKPNIEFPSELSQTELEDEKNKYEIINDFFDSNLSHIIEFLTILTKKNPSPLVIETIYSFADWVSAENNKQYSFAILIAITRIANSSDLKTKVLLCQTILRY